VSARPEFHYAAERGWINDPHGITYRDGQYHSFFQFVPDSTVWAPNCHWGHAVGEDLLSLTTLPVAIAPGEGDEGIWSGALVQDDAGATRIFYTATSRPNIGIGRVRVATPVDGDWIEWAKGDVVAEAPSGLDILNYRDPFVMRDGDQWRMFVAAGLTDGTAAALSYRSTDLASWDYEGIAIQRSTNETDPVWMGALWECPQIIEVDGRHVMVSSIWDDDVLLHAGYAIGTYADGRFTAETWGRLTYGPSYYAPSFFRDADGRPCLTFWMRGVHDLDAGWASAHSLPHVLSLDGDTLVATPHQDVERYRSQPAVGTALDVVWTPGDTGELVVDAGDTALVTLRFADGELTVIGGAEPWSMPAASPIRIILDAQAVEISSPLGLGGVGVAADGSDLRVRAGGDVMTWSLSR
jgi:beta-fructofuranosidase